MAKAKKAAKTKKSPKAASAAAKAAKPKVQKKKRLTAASPEQARVVTSEVVYQGPLFRVTKDHIVEPGGKHATRDVVRHNGSIVIIAVDSAKPGKSGRSSKNRKDPWIVMERQYRHAAGRFLWELPAGKIDAGEEPLAGAQRELEEETGYRAKKWKPLMEYFASPGFVGESMKVFVAEGLVLGHAHPEEDEEIEIRLVRLSEIMKAIDKGEIMDGKTLAAIPHYARLRKR
ncbi:MAG TPA: NUDIX hydrolase [Terracidiphilus sp.]|nr:NUDIX hydrolase [Terracidiphilus sp.]